MIEAIQAWAARYAADRRYSPVGQGFHWTMAALKHHFWDRHDVLRGMLPDLEGDEPEAPKRKPKPRAPRHSKAAG